MKNKLSTQELKEVESTLLSHPEIDEAYVESDRNQEKENNLTAYIAIKEQIELWPSVGEYFLYDESMYLRMATHQEKIEKYAEAFRKVLTGKTVVEIGPGSEAVLSILCLKAGAEKVYAIEYLQDTYEKARSKIESLGLE
ncbi:MAG: hypothetical protein WBA93_04380, partial [Microcoleaceae cyanobacterium]